MGTGSWRTPDAAGRGAGLAEKTPGLASWPLAVLQHELLQAQAALSSAQHHAGQVPDAHGQEVAAAAEVKALEALQPPGDEQKASVGDVTAASQLQHLQALEVLGYVAHVAVGYLLADAQVESMQGADLLH